MASGGLISRASLWLMPALAILMHELRGLLSSWLVRLWLVGTALLAFFTIAASWTQMPSSLLIASLLFSFLVFPWFLVVFMLGIGPVTGTRLESLADGILSRPVTRTEYLLASWAARLIVVLAVYLIVMVPSVVIIAAAKRPAPVDRVTVYGILASLAVVGLVLAFLVSMAFLTGTVLRRPLLAVVILVFTWFPVNLVLHTFSLEQFSPISLSQSLPTLLRTPWRVANVEQEKAMTDKDLEEMSRQAAKFLSILSGGAPAAKPRDGSFFERGDYQDFSLTRVLLGYGIPTLLALGLTLLLFSRRDL